MDIGYPPPINLYLIAALLCRGSCCSSSSASSSVTPGVRLATPGGHQTLDQQEAVSGESWGVNMGGGRICRHGQVIFLFFFGLGSNEPSMFKKGDV